MICFISKYSKEKKIKNFSAMENVEIVNEEKEIVRVLFFFAPWCPYSQKALPLWKKTKQMFKNDSSKIFTLVNSEEDTKNLIDKYEIKSYPSFIITKEDGITKTFKSDRTVKNLSEFIKKNQNKNKI